MSARVINSRLEYLIYFFFWGVLLLAPFSEYVLSGGSDIIEWNNVYRFWLFLLPIFLLFLVNNYILLPFLIKKKRWFLYFLFLTIFIVVACAVSDNYVQPKKPKHLPSFINGNKSPHHVGHGPRHGRVGGGPGIRVKYKYENARFSIHDIYANNRTYQIHPGRPGGLRFIDFILEPDAITFILVVLAITLNGFVKFYFVKIRSDWKIKELEQQTLTTELQYLKFQINPHFFMNTLNNIHVLIDVDKQKAQKSIINLSKMIRYMLYETQDKLVPLSKEIVFIRGFIELMCLRYDKNLTVTANFPAECDDICVPPSLFISFLENAFKHGVAHGKESVIETSINIIQGELVFKCRNTMAKKQQWNHKNSEHGVGLENTRKRLQLLYGDKYILNISRDDKYYNVLLKITISHDEMYHS
ncbi:MAG: GHKL domain-containing protein [Bacteroidales bacterium]|nr:GHKL domain-containing protein [Bacteroidales bacterium]